LWAQTKTTWI